MKHDEKEFLALLQRYGSEDTRRARRNTGVIGFLVIAVHLLDVQLTDVRALGVDMTGKNEAVVASICLLLLAYWVAMFVFTFLHDREVEKERRLQGQEAVNALKKRYEFLSAQNEGKSLHPDWGDVKMGFAAYQRQEARTQKAVRYRFLIDAAELYVPLALAAIAVVFLLVDICGSLT